MAERDVEDEAPPGGVRIAGIARWAFIAVLSCAAAGAWLSTAHPAGRVAKSASPYQCPMHPAVLRDGPGECPICRMELVPAAPHESAAPETGGVPGLVPIEIGPERTQLVGIRTSAVTRQRLTAQLRTTGFVSADESKVALVTTRFSGWVDEVRAQVGERVEKGEVLATVSGPELLTAQKVFLVGKGWAAKQNVPSGPVEEENNALQRLGIAQRDIDAVVRRGRPLLAVPVRAPVSGYIARRSVLPGLYVQPGAELFQIVDLSSVWVVGDVPEHDAGRVRSGQRAQLLLGMPVREAFRGSVDFIFPALDPDTRTLRARVRLPNPDLRLRPGMSGALFIEVPAEETLTAPVEAVVDTGERQYVFVARGGGRFEPRAVRVGASADGRVQVLEGLEEGDSVVTSANFLVDSESRMRGAVEAFAPAREATGALRSARAASGQP
jgi:membrane fusion protein, copper/silver efflux system